MSPRGRGDLNPRGARALEGTTAGRDESRGSREREREMPGGLRLLRHVIRPSRARAFPARAPPLGPHFPSPPPPAGRQGGAVEGPVWPTPAPHPPWSCGCLAHAACSAPWLWAAASGRSPSVSWVMPHEHHQVTFRSLALSKVCGFLTRRFSRLEFPLCPSSISATYLWKRNVAEYS